MGSCSSTKIEGGLFTDQEEDLKHPEQSQSSDSAMGENSAKTDFDFFMDANNTMVQLAKKKFEHCDELRRHNSELMRRDQEMTAENERLRQRYNFCYLSGE